MSAADASAGPLTRGLRATGRFLLRVPWPIAVVLVCAWALLIWDLSSHPAPLPVDANRFWELLSNLAHAPLFGILTLLVAAILLREPGGGWPRPRAGRLALVLALAFGYGVVDEIHQSRIPGRDASALDLVTDFVSAAAVLWIVVSLARADLRERELGGRLLVSALLCVGSAALALLS